MSANEHTHRLALKPGTVIDSFRIERLLGSGGFGLTYLCVHTVLGRKSAIKEMMPNDFATRDDSLTVVAKTRSDEDDFQWARQRFLEECRHLAQFNHPNIIACQGIFEANGTVYMVMDYLEGETYSDKLKREGPQSEDQVRQMLFPLIDGLKQVHAAGLLHRDIKPGNIYMTNAGAPVLLDFGAARFQISTRSRSVTSIVTPGYAPFEQYHTGGNQGPWTDIYSLAAVAYRALTGEAPPEASRREREDPCVPLSKRLAGLVSPNLLAGLDHGMRPREEERPQNLDDWLVELTSGRTEPTTASSAVPPPVPEFPTHAAQPPEMPPVAQLISAAAGPTPVATPIPSAQILPRHLATPAPAPAPATATPAPTPAPIPVATPAPATATVSSRTAASERSSRQVSSARPSGKPRRKKMPLGVLFSVVMLVGTLLGVIGILVAKLTEPKDSPDEKSLIGNSDSDGSDAGGEPDSDSSNPLQRATKANPWINSLGQKFVPVAGTDVLFCTTETRIQDYRKFAEQNSNLSMNWQDYTYSGNSQAPDHPVVMVSWDEAKAFCRWLSEVDGVTYRLPTDHEWSLAVGLEESEFATPESKDGGIRGVYPWGRIFPPPLSAGNFDYDSSGKDDGFVFTAPVASFPPNRFGIYDLSGNVWEWCEDAYSKSSTNRVWRGGSWRESTGSSGANLLLSSARQHGQVSGGYGQVGFRLVVLIEDGVSK